MVYKMGVGRGVRHELAKRTRFRNLFLLISADFCADFKRDEHSIRSVYGVGRTIYGVGRGIGPIQPISDFIYLISAVISSDFRANRTRFHPCRTPRCRSMGIMYMNNACMVAVGSMHLPRIYVVYLHSLNTVVVRITAPP